MTTEHPSGQRLQILGKIVLLFVLVYVFLLSISLMGEALKSVGKDFISDFIAGSSSAFIGLFIGILATSIIQSSSTTTSIVVGLVGGGLFSLQQAIPIIMGANIGTSVTNTIVSFGHIRSKLEFQRAYGAAVVHDIFNFLSVLIFFPLQLQFNIIGKSSLVMTQMFENAGGLSFVSPLKVIIKPVVKVLLHLIHIEWISIIIALIMLFVALRYIVVVMKSLVMDRISRFFDKVVFRTPLVGLFFGIIFTALVQSSSVTTSLIVPLAGAGLVTLSQVFPYTLGANIGTTITALLASLVTASPDAVAVAFAHLMFNIYGIVLWLPLKFVPIKLAEQLAALAVKNRLIPIGIVLLVFVIIPLVLIKIVG